MNLFNRYLFYAVLFTLLFTLLMFFNFGLDTGKGQQSGYITDIENNGWVFRPTRITLLNIQPTFSEKDTSYDFGILPDLEDKAKAYMENKIPVIVKYETRHFVWCWDFYKRTIIYDIQPIVNSDD